MVDVEFKKPNKAMAPPTTPNIPKSDAPRLFRIRRVVYNDTNTVIHIFKYSQNVFFIILFPVDIKGMWGQR